MMPAALTEPASNHMWILSTIWNTNEPTSTKVQITGTNPLLVVAISLSFHTFYTILVKQKYHMWGCT